MKVLRLKNSSLEPGPSSGLRWSPVGFVSVCTYGLLLLHSVAQPESSQCEHSEGPSVFFSSLPTSHPSTPHPHYK